MSDIHRPMFPDDPASLPRLAKGLRQLDAASRQAPVTPDIDAAMRQRIHGHFQAEPVSGHSLWRWRNWRGAAALAACLALVAWIAWPRPQTTVTPPVAKIDPSDLDQDGAITVLDAFSLARIIDSGVIAAGSPDLNQDGRVDRLDVDVIAERAVALA